jgi:hypothetical protein
MRTIGLVKYPDGSMRVVGVVDDDGVYHYIQAMRLNGKLVHFQSDDGWYFCLCNKQHPGPLIQMKASNCLECLGEYNG